MVEYCLLTANMGTLYLQALGNGTKWKTVAAGWIETGDIEKEEV